MKSETHGVGTLEAEVTHISKHGFWLLLLRNLIAVVDRYFTEGRDGN